MSELRDLVGLFKPRDIHPCVEDPEKLTYLDLEGCFGDLCDMSNCTYLAQIRGLPVDNSEEAVENVMAERWAYDDISDDGLDEDSSMNSAVDVELEPKVSNATITNLTVNQPNTNDPVSGSILSPTRVNTRERKTDDPLNEKPINERPNKQIVTRNMSSSRHDVKETAPLSSQESITILWQDNQVSNTEMIHYYMDIVSEGGNITLKSVDGDVGETLL